MLTRSFGDKEMKKYGVLSTPDIYFKNVEKDDIFVVISSDGIWDVVEENEIFEMAQKGISSSDLSKKICNIEYFHLSTIIFIQFYHNATYIIMCIPFFS
jgi:serine/threonine protein phosphatase PrpC